MSNRRRRSEVFGAGIPAADRPSRRGDFIIAGDAQGTVEHGGTRLTPIRTARDSLVFVSTASRRTRRRTIAAPGGEGEAGL